MIVVCPACATRYLVEDEELGGEAGRRVRCASCGHLWRYTPDAAAIHAVVAEMVAEVEQAARAAMPAAQTAAPSQVPIATVRTERRPEPGAGAPVPPAGTAALVRPPVEVTLPAAARRRTARTVGLGLLVLALAVVLLAVLARDRILAVYPTAAPVYATFHLIEPPGAGLEIVTVRTRWVSDSLLVDGTIVNRSQTMRRAPRLRVSIFDGNKSEIGSQVIDPPVAQLQPGATVRFTATFEHPSITASGAEANFVTQ